MAAFVFTHILQMGCQFGQAGGTVFDLFFQQVTFSFERLLLTLARCKQYLGLYQVHVKSQQPDQRRHCDADTRQLQRFFDLALTPFHFLDAGSRKFG